MKTPGAVLAGSYDLWLVVLSVFIAICASYTALGLGARTTIARGSKRIAWLGGGAVAMGFGIWSMHYVGMLAFALPVPVLYDVPTVIASLIAAVFASAVALFVVSRERVDAIKAGVGSLFMGAGIVAMHYTGMAAMRLAAMCDYDMLLVALSCVIAVVGSFAALWFTFHFRATPEGKTHLKVLSALAMGGAIAAMHYTAMSAATFRASLEKLDYSDAVNVSDLGITAIVIVTFLVLAFAFYSSLLDQQLSAQQALADELSRSRQMLQTILDNIPQRVFWKDLQGHYQGCNRAFAADVGLSCHEEAVGKVDRDLPISSTPEPLSRNLNKTLATGQAISNSEYEISLKEGMHRWIRATSIPLRDSSGDLCGVLGTYEDITEHKRAEDAIRRSNAALSDFAHIVSHDLQSPLRVANNYVQLLVAMYGAQLQAEAHTFLSFIESSLRNMSELIQSLLRYSTATDPQPEGQQQVALQSIVDRALANLATLIDEAGAQITWDKLPEVIGHPVQLTQVLQNLISNAIKYRKPGLPPIVEITAREEVDGWTISVRDNGIGIPSEHRNRIFDPLKRLHGPEIPGFGIGLATCRRVVEHHGGRIWVESDRGVGSTFHFTIRRPRTSVDGNIPASVSEAT